MVALDITGGADVNSEADKDVEAGSDEDSEVVPVASVGATEVDAVEVGPDCSDAAPDAMAEGGGASLTSCLMRRAKSSVGAPWARGDSAPMTKSRACPTSITTRSQRMNE